MNCTRIFILRNSETQSKVIVKEVIWSLEISVWRSNKFQVVNLFGKVNFISNKRIKNKESDLTID